MRIINKLGTLITSLDSWKTAFLEVDSKKEHWKEGRSAHSLGHFFDPQKTIGEDKLKEYLRSIPALNGEITFDIGVIEFESKFDQFRGKGRAHDLAIWGNCGSNKLFVGIEAKVDESFGETIENALNEAKKRAKSNSNSKGVERINGLTDKFLSNIDSAECNKLRYQLLHYLAGTLTQAQRSGASIAIMPVLVFKTSDYNPSIASENKKDYEMFMNALFEKSATNNGDSLYSKTYGDIVIYSFYKEISL